MTHAPGFTTCRAISIGAFIIDSLSMDQALAEDSQPRAASSGNGMTDCNGSACMRMGMNIGFEANDAQGLLDVFMPASTALVMASLRHALDSVVLIDKGDSRNKRPARSAAQSSLHEVHEGLTAQGGKTANRNFRLRLRSFKCVRARQWRVFAAVMKWSSHTTTVHERNTHRTKADRTHRRPPERRAARASAYLQDTRSQRACIQPRTE